MVPLINYAYKLLQIASLHSVTLAFYSKLKELESVVGEVIDCRNL